ncbi:MAG: hypothetical protein FWF08_08575, partial [Oscillospiraceae bacterium]|nr:hypothetical protein [Oscillospiraceae bacterium]
MTHTEILHKTYDAALDRAFSMGKPFEGLSAEIKEDIEYLVSRSENNKAIVTVLTTLLTHKQADPLQDIRYHQKGLPGGFSGRVIDKAEITP